MKYVLDKSLKLSSFQTDRKGSDLLIYHCSCCSDNIKRQMMPDHSQLQPQLSAQGCRKRGGMGVPLQIWADWSTLSQPEGEGVILCPPYVQIFRHHSQLQPQLRPFTRISHPQMESKVPYNNMGPRWFSVGICTYKPGYKSHDLL